MKRIGRSLALPAALLVVFAAAGTVFRAQAPAPTPFTPAQANQGGMTFNSLCRGCHDPSRFSSESFTRRWEGRTVSELVAFLRNAEPRSLHGGYPDVHYLELTAFVLELNGLTSGPDALPSDPQVLENIRIHWPED